MAPNAAAAASHDPCQPTEPGEVYFNSATVLPDQVTAFGLIQDGVLIAPGESKAIELDLYSDAPTSGPWSVGAIDYQTLLGNPAELGFSFDRRTGQSGDKLKMTITVLRTNPSKASPFAVVANP